MMQTNDRSQNLSFLPENHSIASTISQLHQYFRNAAAYGQIDRACLMQLLETVDSDRESSVLAQIQKIDTEIALLKVIEDALSIANRVIHTHTAMSQFGLDSRVYTVPEKSLM
jgi:hypothetical protein